jgi:hypothetical protein
VSESTSFGGTGSYACLSPVTASYFDCVQVTLDGNYCVAKYYVRFFYYWQPWICTVLAQHVAINIPVNIPLTKVAHWHNDESKV